MTLITDKKVPKLQEKGLSVQKKSANLRVKVDVTVHVRKYRQLIITDNDGLSKTQGLTQFGNPT